MPERFRIGDVVRTNQADPPHHTRLPGYARGAAGTVTGLLGRHPLPDRRARGLPAEPEPVYAVRFAASELFGTGDHTVTISLWESYLRPAAQKTAGSGAPGTTGDVLAGAPPARPAAGEATT